MIKAENVNYIYQQGMPFERQALYDVNIEIKDGSLVALIGHTGSGKSTLIQHFNALVKPTSDLSEQQSDLCFNIPNISFLKKLYIKILHSVLKIWDSVMKKLIKE